ncbi:MAG: trehalose-phosphatase [Pseudomonadota bacterium]
MHETLTQLPDKVDWRKYAFYLDFDGTLAPIVDRPGDVRVDERTRQSLSRLQCLTDGAVAVISGRAIADLEGHLAPTVCAVSGSHGLEFKAVGQVAQMVTDATEILGPALDRISDFAAQHGLLVEDKPGAVTVHYRGRAEAAAAARSLVDRVAAGSASLRAMHGNMVSEVAIAGVDKGSALRQFMLDTPFSGRLPITAGDDVTDEDAFRAANDLHGFSIKIGPGQTEATYRVGNIDDFLAWLWQVTDPPND